MIKLFEAFKKYHNANYHDGDDTFDDEVYKKSNGEDFDDPFVQECFDHFEAGWNAQNTSRQKLSKIAVVVFGYCIGSNHLTEVEVIESIKDVLGGSDE